MRKNCTNGEPCPQERSLKAKKNLTTEVYQALEITNRGILKINHTYTPVVNLEMVAGSDSNVTRLAFTWKCVDFKPEYMDFKLNFTFFDEVSI